MKLTVTSFLFIGVVIFPALSAIAQNQNTSFSGNIDQVWEDGFRLASSDRSITVDSYSVCGDNTTSHLSVDDRVTVIGEFDGREFDAFSITKADGTSVCK